MTTTIIEAMKRQRQNVAFYSLAGFDMIGDFLYKSRYTNKDRYTNESFVYVMTSGGGMVKIGVSDIPEKRLRNLSTSHPFSLRITHKELVGTRTLAYAIEADAHGALSDFRGNGEWFHVSDDVAVGIVQVVVAYRNGLISIEQYEANLSALVPKSESPSLISRIGRGIVNGTLRYGEANAEAVAIVYGFVPALIYRFFYKKWPSYYQPVIDSFGRCKGRDTDV